MERIDFGVARLVSRVKRSLQNAIGSLIVQRVAGPLHRFVMKTKFLKSKWIFYLAFILAAGLLVLLFYPRDEGCRVESVIDGDTIVLSN